ncbi:phosphoesterase [Candidatus Woesearchaeota archaeon]|nr:phosphoesterase [Candidatus Woesearchaeota archaeon]
MEARPVRMVNLALYLDNILIISDIHMGYEEALNMQGILLPRMQFREIIKNLDSVFKSLKGRKIKKVIINGDLKHEFGKISNTEWRYTLRLLDYLSERCDEIVLIRGNHDTILGPVARKRNVMVKGHELLGDTLVIHGDKLPSENILKNIKTIIIGHEHPAVSLKDGPRIEKYKCFLIGKWKKYSLIVMPSFTPVAEGTDILKEQLLSPFLRNIKNFDVFVVGDKVYDFGKVRDLS